MTSRCNRMYTCLPLPSFVDSSSQHFSSPLREDPVQHQGDILRLYGQFGDDAAPPDLPHRHQRSLGSGKSNAYKWP